MICRSNLTINELLTVSAAMKLFPSTRSPLLDAMIRRIIARMEENTISANTDKNNLGKPSLQRLASQILNRRRQQQLGITKEEALLLSQVTGINGLPAHNTASKCHVTRQNVGNGTYVLR